MKKILFLTLAFLILIYSQSYATNRYGCTALTGGGTGALDALDITASGAPNSDDLADGDSAIVTVISGTTVTVYEYIFDADGTDTESSPDVIRPDDYSSGGVWRLVKIHEDMIPDLSSSYQPADSDLDSLASGINGLLKGAGNGSGYSAASPGVDYVAPSANTTFSITLDDGVGSSPSLFFQNQNDIAVNLALDAGDFFVLDLLDGSDTTFYVKNSDAGVLNLDVEGDVNIGSGRQYKIAGSQISSADLSDGSSLMKNLIEDTSPQLGGNLDSNNFNIYIGDGTYSWDHSPILGCEGAVEIDGTLYADGGIQTGASAQPGVTGDDSDTTASPDWKIYGDATDTTAGSEDVDLFIQTLVDGSMTTLLQFDANGNIEVAKDINLASGKKYKINGSQISSDDLSDATTINTNLLEFINKDLTTLHSGKDEWVYIPTTCSWTSVHVGYDGTVTDLVFTVYSADSPYGTATTVGTIDPDNSPSVSGWSNITAGKWVKMEVTTASTGDATACQVAFVLTNQ